jgi:hypothetical protein
MAHHDRRAFGIKMATSQTIAERRERERKRERDRER